MYCVYMYSIWLIGRGCADIPYVLFPKVSLKLPYVTFCGEIAVERLLRVGYLGCLGKGWREG